MICYMCHFETKKAFNVHLSGAYFSNSHKSIFTHFSSRGHHTRRFVVFHFFLIFFSWFTIHEPSKCLKNGLYELGTIERICTRNFSSIVECSFFSAALVRREIVESWKWIFSFPYICTPSQKGMLFSCLFLYSYIWSTKKITAFLRNQEVKFSLGVTFFFFLLVSQYDRFLLTSLNYIKFSLWGKILHFKLFSVCERVAVWMRIFEEHFLKWRSFIKHFGFWRMSLKGKIRRE